jgi:hypothetical protein
LARARSKPRESLPDWEKVLSASARLQRLLPGAVLVGGTAAALHAGHRRSRDADHVLRDLRSRFERVLRQLESLAGWRTRRVKRPVMILGSLNGIEVGVRQLIRKRPLETRFVGAGRSKVEVPTPAETLRIKALLLSRRNATRDFLDFVALADRLGRRALDALASLDELYEAGGGGNTVSQDLLARLSNPQPVDLDDINLSEYKGLHGKWRKWTAVDAFCRELAVALADRLLAARRNK